MSDSSDSETKVQLKLKMLLFFQEYLNEIFIVPRDYTVEELIDTLYVSLYDASSILLNLWKNSVRTSVHHVYAINMRLHSYDILEDKNEINLDLLSYAVSHIIDKYFRKKDHHIMIADFSEFMKLHKDIIREVNGVTSEKIIKSVATFVKKYPG